MEAERLAETAPALRIERLSAGFESQVVVRGISFDVPHTGVVALMGPAGVGKSTLLRTIGRYNEQRPAFWVHGNVRFGDRDLLRDYDVDEAHRVVALLAQRARLFTATVLENAIAMVAEGRQLTFGEKRRMARDVLEPWGLWDKLARHLDAPVTTLSIAQQRALTLARLVSGGAACILADEPLRDIPEDERANLIALFGELKRRLAVIMITHDQAVARALADTVCLVTAGMLVEVTPGSEFFSSPRTDLGRDFLRSGNCWPVPADDPRTAPEPRVSTAPPPAERHPSWAPTPEEAAQKPGGFHWVVPGLLGGMQWPGLLVEEHTDLHGLSHLDVRHLVTLTEEPFNAGRLARYGIHGTHFPIVDMGVPTVEDALQLTTRISNWMDAGEPTVVHCKAGLGRTGTILACVLVARGVDPVRAIHEVRLVNPRYIQSEAQLSFIESFGSFLGGTP